MCAFSWKGKKMHTFSSNLHKMCAFLWKGVYFMQISCIFPVFLWKCMHFQENVWKCTYFERPLPAWVIFWFVNYLHPVWWCQILGWSQGTKISSFSQTVVSRLKCPFYGLFGRIGANLGNVNKIKVPARPSCWPGEQEQICMMADALMALGSATVILSRSRWNHELNCSHHGNKSVADPGFLVGRLST